MSGGDSGNAAAKELAVVPAGIGHNSGEPTALGGGIEGAERTTRELARWSPSRVSPDRAINPVKAEADARGRDMVQNDGYALGAANLHKDSIVGAQYRLNANPDWEFLGADEGWAEEFQRVVESRFSLIAESPACWFDAARKLTFTDKIRLAVGVFVATGEVLETSEWLREDGLRPLQTAFQSVSPDRLSNPNDMADTQNMRRGVERDIRGKPLAYHIRTTHPSDWYAGSPDLFNWKRVRAETPWGRWMVLHILEQRLPDQSRGIADLVSVLKDMKMAKQFKDVTLQNAVVNASYAAAIESELPTETLIAAMGGNREGLNAALMWQLGSMAAYYNSADNVSIDGVKIPHFFPGTKLKLLPMGTPGGVGTEFEVSLLRHIAAGLGLSYEEFARDYTKTNYSSARASMATTWRYMQSKKKTVADRMASAIYSNVVEEFIARGEVPLPRGRRRDWFYTPLVREALCRCTWIGAARGQIDETKETEAAALRIATGLSTLEAECAKLGQDYREVLRQRAREQREIKALGVVVQTGARPQAQPAQQGNEANVSEQ